MILFSEFEGLNQNLINADLFANKNNDHGTTNVSVDDKLSDYKIKQFSNIIVGEKSTDLSKIFYNLNDFTNKSGASGLGVFVEQLYKASDLKGIK